MMSCTNLSLSEFHVFLQFESKSAATFSRLENKFGSFFCQFRNYLDFIISGAIDSPRRFWNFVWD